MSIKNQADLGANVWIVDEMYHEYLENPSKVSESWREFFEDYRPGLLQELLMSYLYIRQIELGLITGPDSDHNE